MGRERFEGISDFQLKRFIVIELADQSMRCDGWRWNGMISNKYMNI